MDAVLAHWGSCDEYWHWRLINPRDLLLTVQDAGTEVSVLGRVTHVLAVSPHGGRGET